MNQKQRLLATIKRLPVDRPPFICPGGMMSMIVTEVMAQEGAFWPGAHTDAHLMARLAAAANRIAGVENLGVPFCMTVEAEAMGARVDLGSQENEPRVVEYAMKSLKDLDRLTKIKPSSGRVQVCCDAVRLLKASSPEVPVVANLTGPVSLATSLVDPLVYYRALRRDKDAAHALTALAMENAIVFGELMIEAGADLICIADPSATGELIGGAAFAEFVLPYLNLMTEHFRTGFGVPAIVHICGDVKSLGGRLNELAAEVVSVDAMVGISRLRELAPEKLTMGNVSTQLLEQGTAEAVSRAGRSCLSLGVDILAPACGIGPRTPVENILSLARCARAAGSCAASLPKPEQEREEPT